MMTRRSFTAMAAAGAAASATTAISAEGTPPRTRMGVATTSYMTVWRPRDTHQFLEHCHGLGAGGIQAPLASLDAAYVHRLRDRAGELGMYYEAMIGLPKGDPAQFEATVRAVKEAGAPCARAGCLGGRRYETFASMEEWKAFVAQSKASLRQAISICEKHKLPLAVENHKDWTLEEHIALLKEFENPYFGVTLDAGNNVSLLDDAMVVIEALAPYAIATHVKDMGVELYKDGFLLSELPLGEGYVDLKRMVALVRQHRPDTRFTLEMITRNPLAVPCLTEKYWATMPEREGVYLARTLRTVRKETRSQPLPRIDTLPPAAQRRWEEDNVKQCLRHAREQLGLAA